MTVADPTLDPDLRSWVLGADGSDFPIQSLPYGVIRRRDGATAVAVRIGDHALDLAAAADAGLLDGVPREALAADALNGLLALGRATWTPLRRRVSELLRAGGDELAGTGVAGRALVALADVAPLLPVRPGDYVDFYSSLEHATNLGRIFRPTGEALQPNWRHLPVGYHGRSGSLVVSGTPVRRPRGQRRGAQPGDPPDFGPSERLDFELEVGFVTGPASALGEPIPISRAREHIFGLVLVNDWTARDIQSWEYVPLGPFLGKSFATTVSPWVVPLDVLDAVRVPGVPQEPPVLPYLVADEDWALDVVLEVALAPADADAAGDHTVSRTNLRHLYWSIAQQLAHATVNGADARPGDLYASGTISGADAGSLGSLIELSWNGERPLRLVDGSPRSFLADGDTVTLRAHAELPGGVRIGFGEAAGQVLPAREETR